MGKRPVDTLRGTITKAEYLERKAQELKITDRSILVPPELTDEDLIKKYLYLASTLDDMGIWCTLDNDELARYVEADATCAALNVAIIEAIKKGEIDDAERLQKMQHRAFNQAHSLASSMCLNILGRNKVPRKPTEEEKKNEIVM